MTNWLNSCLWKVLWIADTLWRIKVPKKAKFFSWQVLLGRVNLLDWLLRKYLLVGPFCCIHCRKVEEDLDYLLWGCEFVRSIWNCFFQEFGFMLVSCFDRGVPPPSASLGRRVAFFGRCGCILWVLWRERNKRVYRGLEKDPSIAWSLVKCYVPLWALISKTICNYSLGNILWVWFFVCRVFFHFF